MSKYLLCLLMLLFSLLNSKCNDQARNDTNPERHNNNNNNNGPELLNEYNQQFEDYIAELDNPKNPPAWTLSNDALTEYGRYKLPEKVKTYVNSIADRINTIKDKSQYVLKDMSSLNKVFVLKNTPEIQTLEDCVYKNNAKKRINAIEDAQKIVKTQSLDTLYVPKFASADDNSYILEERISDLNPSFEFQEELFTFLFEKAQNDEELKKRVTKMLTELTTLVCKANIDDIKYDNFPLSQFGKIIILDPEKGGGDIKRLLNHNTNEFYIHPDYIEDIVQAAKESGSDFCKIIAEANPQAIADAKNAGNDRYKFIKGFMSFKIKRKIITGKEIFGDQDIQAAQNLFQDTQDKLFAKLVLLMLNQDKQHDSRIVASGDFKALFSKTGIGLEPDSKIKTLHSSGNFPADYFKIIDGTKPSPAMNVLYTLQEHGFIYEIASTQGEVGKPIAHDYIKVYF